MNACAGIPTELLDQGLGLGAILNSEAIEYSDLEKQRDELLAALENIANTDPDEGTAWFHAIADKAISGVKGEI